MSPTPHPYPHPHDGKARAPWAQAEDFEPQIKSERHHKSKGHKGYQGQKGQKPPPLWQTFVPAKSVEGRASAESRPVSLTEAHLAAATNAINQDGFFSQHLYTLRSRGNDLVDSGSSDRGLSPASSFQSNRAMSQNVGVCRAKPRSDIRSAIAPKHHLRSHGDKWVKVNWDVGPFDKIDDDTIFSEPSFVGKFVIDWMKDAVDNIRVDLSVSNHWNSDIETETGRFLMPVIMPETVVDPEPITDDPGWNFRRQNMTSDLMLKKHMADMARRAKDEKNKIRGANGDWRAFIRVDKNPKAQTGYRLKPSQAPPVGDISSGRPSVRGSIGDNGISATAPAMDGRGRYALGPRSSLSPAVPCFLRPAENKDLSAVTNIYNWEVTQGMQTLDSSPLTVEEFEKILVTTEQLGMPFIVAVRGSARDIKADTGNFEFSPYLQRSPYLADSNDIKKNGAILGFVYLSVWEPGLAGDGNGSSRASARINIFVDPEYRKKKIGYSLLDKLLSTVSRRFKPEQAYDFVDLSNSLVYKHPLGHERQYFRLYLTYFVKHSHDVLDRDPESEKKQKSNRDDLVWVKKLLEKKFGFVEKACFETSHRSSKYIKDRPIYWLDSVVFEHACHLDARFTNDY